VAFLLALSALPRAGDLTRAGFSPDEEISIFAVRGISSTGLPTLPSGVVYTRGLLYSYLAWGSGLLFGDTLPAYRAPSLVAGCAAVALTAALAARLGGAAWIAGLIACWVTWLVVASSWARFYSAFVALFVATVLTRLDGCEEGPPRSRARWFLAGLVMSSLLHEMAVTLLAIPLFYAVDSRAGRERRAAIALLAQSLLAWGVVQLILAASNGPATHLVRTAPPVDLAAALPRTVTALAAHGSLPGLALMAGISLLAGLLAIRLRAPWPFGIAVAACCATLNLGLLALATTMLLLALPERARSTAVAALAGAAASVIAWLVFARLHIPSALDLGLVSSVVNGGLAFPLDGAVELIRRWPLAAASALAGLLLSWRVRSVRLTAFVALAVLAFLGVLTLGPKPRYFLPLLPLLIALSATVPIALGRFVPAGGLARPAASTTVALALGVTLVLEHETGGQDPLLQRGGEFGLSRLRSAPFERWAVELGGRATDGPLICSDDLGCLLLGRRPDYWWLGSQSEAERYGIRDARGYLSTYTGARILVGDEGSEALASHLLQGGWLIALRTVKYPGPAGYADGPSGSRLQVECETPGMVVLRVRGQVGRPRSEMKEVPRCAGG
jgi:hypothetical protein